jgi:nucleotide-binding universal stress UspA family protein
VTYRTILVGFDGSDHGRDALTLAIALARRTGASLTLACAIHHAPAYLPIERLEDEFRTDANGVLDAAMGELPAGVEARGEVVMARSAARALVELAEAEDADVIVLGSSHHGVVGRVFAGSVGQQVLDGAPCAVAIAPAGFRERDRTEPELIGVGLDGEPESVGALLAAETVAAAFGASLRLISVIGQSDLFVPRGSTPEVYDALESAARTHAREVIDAAMAALSPDLRVEGEIVDGPIAPSLEAAAKAAGIDLLIVGSRGFGPRGASCSAAYPAIW